MKTPPDGGVLSGFFQIGLALAASTMLTTLAALVLPTLAGVLGLLAGPLLTAALLLARFLLAALLVLRILVLLRHVFLHLAARPLYLTMNCGAETAAMWRSPADWRCATEPIGLQGSV